MISYALQFRTDHSLTRCTEPTKSTPYAQFDHNDSQLSSVTPSQSASQIALAITSDDSPARSSSIAHHANSPLQPSSPLHATNPSASSPLHIRPVIISEPEHREEPDFKLNIGPAHSIDDHSNIHESIPSSSAIIPPKKSHLVDSSDEELAKAPLEVHENSPFKQTSPKRVLSQKPPSITGGTGTARETRGTLKRPPPQRRDSKQEKSKVGFPMMVSQKSKHSSDIGPRTYATAPTLSPGDAYSPIRYKPEQTLARKRSTSFSLMGGFTGLFKGKKRSASAERSYPMSTGGWHTRTDKNLTSVRRGRAGSSSEDELPSTLARKARHLDQESIDTEEPKKISKRISNTVTRHKSPKQDSEGGSKYVLVERGEHPTGDLVRTGSQSSRRSANISSSETARETAANTALNAGNSTTRRQSLPAQEHFAFPRRQEDALMNRLHGDVNARDLSTSEQRISELSKLSERLKRLEEVGRERNIDGGREREPVPPLGPGKLEVVRAPPSITQVPLLFHPTPSTSYGESPGSSTFKDPNEGRGHRRMSSLSGAGTGMNPPLNGGVGANLKARPSNASNRDSVPLKPALKSPTRQGSAPLPSLSSTLVKRDGMSPTRGEQAQNQSQQEGGGLHLPDHRNSASPPTPLGARDGLLANGDSIFIPNFMAGLRSPPTTSSSLVPSPRRLSEIPASVRASVADDVGDDESVYETPDEDLSGEETEETIEGGATPSKVATMLPTSDTGNTIRAPKGGSIPVRNGTPAIAVPSNGKHVPLKLNEPINLNDRHGDSSDRPRDSLEIESGEGPSASNSTTSTGGTTRRKSVRMLIYPTVAVSPPERYDDEPSPKAKSRLERAPSPPLTPASGSTIRATGGSGRGTGIDSARSSLAGPIPGAWETRINTSRNAWDDSSDEDEEYKRARRVLARAFEPYGEEKRHRRA
jgi:hypothetical protein